MPLAQQKVLVLNKTWTPISLTTLRRALKLVSSDKARVIDPTREFSAYTWADWRKLIPADGERTVGLIDCTLRVPEVVLLGSYNKVYRERVNFSRRTIYKRDNETCQYCGVRPGTEELSIDHIVPRAQGGVTSWDNCVLACVECNARKADKTPEQAGMKLLKRPEKPKWNLFRGDVRVESWQHFLGEAYWMTELDRG